MTLLADKAALRIEALAWRSQVEPVAARAAADAIQKNTFGAIPFMVGQVVGAYWPLKHEIDVRPLMGTLHDRGHPIVLPVVVDQQSPLVFRTWWPGAPLERSVLGTSVPSAGVEVIRPDVVLVPALAIDDKGYRLGYGGGYYDRTIAQLRVAGNAETQLLAVGVCFECQRIVKVPHGRADERLDWIVTEIGATRMK